MKASKDNERRVVPSEVANLVNLKVCLYRLTSKTRRLKEKISTKRVGPYYAIHPLFDISQLMKAVETAVTTQQLPPSLSKDLEWLVEPENILKARASHCATKVQVKWRGPLDFELMWEPTQVIQARFIEFQLEDKLKSAMGSNGKIPLLTYRCCYKKCTDSSPSIVEVNEGWVQCQWLGTWSLRKMKRQPIPQQYLFK